MSMRTVKSSDWSALVMRSGSRYPTLNFYIELNASQFESLEMFARLGMLPMELLTIASNTRTAIGFQSRLISSSNLPRVAQPSLWHSIVPKFLRSRRIDPQSTSHTSGDSSKEWNTATPFLILGVLVGSQAIHLINLKKDIVHFSRKADAKITLLREVIRRVQAGENVDVEKVLGTGDPTSEREWEDVMKEVENDDHLWQEKRWKVNRKAKLQAAREQQQAGKRTPENDSSTAKAAAVTLQPGTKSRFY